MGKLSTGERSACAFGTAGQREVVASVIESPVAGSTGGFGPDAMRHWGRDVRNCMQSRLGPARLR
jgi:hypothetical protein